MSNPAFMLRTFVGVPLSGECRAVSTELLRVLRGPRGPLGSEAARGARISCPPPERQHLTLKFLGDTDPDAVPVLAAALAKISFPPFLLQLEGAGYFPNVARPSVLWAGVGQGADALATLAGQVNAALAPQGHVPETRPYHPHLTLGRVRAAGGADWNAVQQLVAGCSWPEMRVSRFVFWKSELKPGGAVYTPLGEVDASLGQA
ncbi:MAG: RNA 2',3'-cyclic phosphodiesterase [Desulfovibrio sp.]